MYVVSYIQKTRLKEAKFKSLNEAKRFMELYWHLDPILRIEE